MDAVKNFLLDFLPFVAIYLGALSVVRNDIKKLEKKINDLEEKIENLNKWIYKIIILNTMLVFWRKS